MTKKGKIVLEAGLPSGEVDFLFGYFAGNSKDYEQSKLNIINLCKTFFFAGIYYAKTSKPKNLKYFYKGKNKTKKRGIKTKKYFPNYMG